jgi:hypothetical protein
MPRRELARLFPDGKTLHRPAEGGQMPGYNVALADYKRRVGSSSILVSGGSSTNSDKETKQGKSLLAALFSRADEDEGDFNDAPEAVAEKPAKKVKEEPKEEILTASAEDEKIAAPVPRVRPAFAEEETETLQTALLSTKKNAAEDAMKAALTPQIEALETASKEDASKDDEKSEFSNLAEYKIPVPELLGERKRPGDGEEVLTASAETLDGATMAALGGVPVPAFRPEDGQKLVTAAADDLNAPAPDLKADEVAALARETGEKLNADVQTDEDEVAGMIDSLDGADKTNADANLAEMASLDMPKTTVTRGFSIPASLPEDEAAVTPKAATKGHRLTRAEANADANDSTRIEPKLTQNLIAQWALTKGRAEEIAKPVKAPRFVSRTMRKQPTAVYADGFSLSTAEVDPDRFSGTAVNFMPVKKFEN